MNVKRLKRCIAFAMSAMITFASVNFTVLAEDEATPDSLSLAKTVNELNRTVEYDASEVIPGSYDGREIATSIKNQETTNLCCYFVLTGVLEANVKTHKSLYTSQQLAAMQTEVSGVMDINFYEAYLAYSTAGDDYNKGINFDQGVRTLGQWKGVISVSGDNEDGHYKWGESLSKVNMSQYSGNLLHISKYIRLSNSTDKNVIKRYIMDNGAVAAIFHYDASNNTEIWNSTTYAYRNKSEDSSQRNHYITLVGWDDSFSKSNFPEGNQPESDGAWLCKQSYGTTFGDGGYFWVAYDDPSFDSYETVYCEPSDNYDKMYEISPNIINGTVINDNNETTIFNTFTAESDEMIEAVSVPVSSGGAAVEYEISVYKNFDAFDGLGETDYQAVSEMPEAAQTVSGTFEDTAFSVIKLEHPVAVKAGEKYAVAAKVKSQNNNTYYYEINTDKQEKGRSYIYHDADNKVVDAVAKGGNLSLKAYTSLADKYVYTDNGDGTHTFTHKIADGDERGIFAGRTTTESHDVTDNGDGTHTINCRCGKNDVENEGHTLIDGICSVCKAVSYIDPTADSSKYKKVSEYKFITEDMTNLDTGWYVVSGKVVLNSDTARTIAISGDVNIILADGAELDIKNGCIDVPKDNSLTIYGQSAGSGKIDITDNTVSGHAGIGSGSYATDTGDITINGGTVIATGAIKAAGIGGGAYSVNGKITINGGDITANGGGAGEGYVSGSGAGIGSGCYDSETVYTPADIVITGGNIKANGAECSGNAGAGIGAGWNCNNGTITITGGTIVASSNGNGAAIGSRSTTGNGAITIQNLYLFKGEGENKEYVEPTEQAAALQTSTVTLMASDTTLTHIDRVEATCAKDGNIEYWVDVRGYCYSDAEGTNQIQKEDVILKATGEHSWADNVCTVCNTKRVQYVDYDKAEPSWCESYTQMASDTTGSTVNLAEGWYVVEGDITISGRLALTGNVSIILADDASLTVGDGIDVPENTSLVIYAQEKGTGRLTATAKTDGHAGIGTTSWQRTQPGGDITIRGGIISATGINGGAGIGGGHGSQGGRIRIAYGTVIATGAATGNSYQGGAGIGGGHLYGYSDIFITGGNVTATGIYSGIGFGTNASGGASDEDSGSISITGGSVAAIAKNDSGRAIGKSGAVSVRNVIVYKGTGDDKTEVTESDYETAFASKSVTIAEPLKLEGISASDVEVTYDGEAHSINIEGTQADDVITYSTDGLTYSEINPQFTDVAMKEDGSGIESRTVYYKVYRSGYSEYTDNAQVKILPAAVKVSGIEVLEKTYDGTDAATLDYSKVILNGIVASDDGKIRITAKGSFQNADAGTGKTVNITDIALAAADDSSNIMDNYILADSGQQITASADVLPLPVTLSWNGDAEFTYDCTEHSVVASITNAINGDDIPLTYSQNSAADAGNYTAKVTALGNLNYTLEGAVGVSCNWSIKKADAAPGKPDGTIKVAENIEKVGDITLPDNWRWNASDAEKSLSDDNAVTADAVYCGADKGNYNIESVTITITRVKCIHANTELRNAVSATCTKAGYTGDTYCKDCGELLSKGKSVAALGHSYKAAVTKRPTADAEGVKTYTCSRCKASYTEKIAKLTVIYTVKFNGNGADSGTVANQKITYGTKTALSANKFQKKGYTFKGWNTKKDGTGTTYADKTDGSKLTKTNGATVTLYAQWTANKYTITFNGNGSTSGSMKNLSNLQYGKTYTLTKNSFKKKGYTFKGWNTKKDGSGKTYKNKAEIKNLSSKSGGKVTLYAQWSKTKYTITYNLNKGKNNKNNPSSYNITTKTIKLKNPTRKGYTFKGWYSDKKCTKKVTQIKKGSTGNVTLYAKWSKTK